MDFTYQPVERYRAIMALLFSNLFNFFFRLIVEPVAVYCGVSSKKRVAIKENPILEKEYKRNKTKLDYAKIQVGIQCFEMYTFLLGTRYLLACLCFSDQPFPIAEFPRIKLLHNPLPDNKF